MLLILRFLLHMYCRNRCILETINNFNFSGGHSKYKQKFKQNNKKKKGTKNFKCDGKLCASTMVVMCITAEINGEQVPLYTNSKMNSHLGVRPLRSMIL